METRKVKILQNTMAGGEYVQEGKEVELSPRDAHLLTNIGRATYTDRMVEPKGKDTRAVDPEALVKGMDTQNAAISKGKKKP